MENKYNPDTPERIFAARVRAERLRRGWKQEDLAERVADAGVPLYKSAFSKIEGGTKAVGLNEAVAIAAAFGLYLSEMLIPDPPGLTAELEKVTAELEAAGGEAYEASRRVASLWNRRAELATAAARERERR